LGGGGAFKKRRQKAPLCKNEKSVRGKRKRNVKRGSKEARYKAVAVGSNNRVRGGPEKRESVATWGELQKGDGRVSGAPRKTGKTQRWGTTKKLGPWSKKKGEKGVQPPGIMEEEPKNRGERGCAGGDGTVGGNKSVAMGGTRMAGPGHEGAMGRQGHKGNRVRQRVAGGSVKERPYPLICGKKEGGGKARK